MSTLLSKLRGLESRKIDRQGLFFTQSLAIYVLVDFCYRERPVATKYTLTVSMHVRVQNSPKF